MVSLEQKLSFLKRINSSPKLAAFYNLLKGKDISIDNLPETNEADDIFFGIIKAIHKNDKDSFEKYYSKKSRSNPSTDSPPPFVNDDFLIFALIVGILKFNFDKNWINRILSLRPTNIYTYTHCNILSEDIYSKRNQPAIVLMSLKLTNPSLITGDLLRDVYKSINDFTDLFENKSDFNILCAITAYDLIVEQNISELYLLKSFNITFLNRIKVLSWIIRTFILVTLFYFLYLLITIRPEIKQIIDKIGPVIKVVGLIGLSQIGNLSPLIKKKVFEITLRLFGYPKEMIEYAE